MHDNGLIDANPRFGPAYYFSWQLQCAAAAAVAYKIQQYCTYSILRYNWIHLLQSCPAGRLVKNASLHPVHFVQAPTRGQCRLPLAVPAPPQAADAGGHQPMEARSTHWCPKSTSRLKLAWKHEACIEVKSPKFPELKPEVSRSSWPE